MAKTEGRTSFLSIHAEKERKKGEEMGEPTATRSCKKKVNNLPKIGMRGSGISSYHGKFGAPSLCKRKRRN